MFTNVANRYSEYNFGTICKTRNDSDEFIGRLELRRLEFYRLASNMEIDMNIVLQNIFQNMYYKIPSKNGEPDEICPQISKLHTDILARKLSNRDQKAMLKRINSKLDSASSFDSDEELFSEYYGVNT